MDSGLFLVGWDNIYGSFVELSYNPSETLETAKLVKYLMTVQSLATSKSIQIQDENRTVLIFGLPIREKQSFNYDFLVMVLDPELGDVDNYKLILQADGELILRAKGAERKQLFQILAHKLLKPIAQKVIFIGLPNAGKTSTRKFFFEKINEEKLLNTSLIPTQGFENTSYNYIDLNLILFDTAGQEMSTWLDETDQVLQNSDLIVFFFSIFDWQENQEYVLKTIRKLNERVLRKENQIQKLILFCHKIDCIQESIVEFETSVKKKMKDLEIPIFFTSIKNGGNFDLMLGFQLLLNEFSSVLTIIMNQIALIFDFHKYHFQPIFLTDSANRKIYNFKKTDPIFEDINKLGLLEIPIEDIIPKLLNYRDTNLNNPKFFMFWYPSIQKYLLCVDIHYIHPDFRYLFLIGKKIHDVEIFSQNYESILQNSSWFLDKI